MSNKQGLVKAQIMSGKSSPSSSKNVSSRFMLVCLFIFSFGCIYLDGFKIFGTNRNFKKST